MNTAIIGSLLTFGQTLIGKWFPDPEEADKRQKEFQAMVLNGDMKELETLASIIKTESSSDHFIVAAWRPLLMMLFGVIIANNYVIYPYLSLFINDAPMLDLPPEMWDLLKLGIGGYIVGRSAEKSIANFKK